MILNPLLKISTNRKEIILIILCFLAYTMSYLTRYSYNANVNPIIEFYSISKAEFGLVGTFFFAAYGIGQFINAFLCKKYNKRVIIPLALGISSILNIVLFFKPAFSIYKYLWLLNGFILSILWPTLIQILSENISEKNMKLSVIIMSISVAAGTLLIYGFSAIFNYFNSYQYIFILAPSFGIVTALSWLYIYPKLLSIDKLNEIKDDDKKIENNIRSSSSKLFMISILFAMGFLMAVCNLTKDGITTWVPSILKETFALDDGFSLVLTLILPIFGIFGTTIAVFLNGKLKNYMSSSFVLIAITVISIGFIILGLKQNILALVLIMFGIVTLMMHGINNLISNDAPMAFHGRISGGLLGGIMNGCGYIGSTISLFGLGLLSDNYGWNMVFVFLLISCGVCLIISLIFIFVTINIKKIK